MDFFEASALSSENVSEVNYIKVPQHVNSGCIYNYRHFLLLQKIF